LRLVEEEAVEAEGSFWQKYRSLKVEVVVEEENSASLSLLQVVEEELIFLETLLVVSTK
jgi:hypothetical protein